MTPADVGIRTYSKAQAVHFRKTKEGFGALSNMASGFPLRVNGVYIRSSEALYQACRFPHLPEVQRLIIQQTSPMTAKMVSKPHRENSRQDWEQMRIRIMKWCLRVKLAQHWEQFRELLLSTGDVPIVEESRRDEFWGAKEAEGDVLIGANVLGRLLMELRERLRLPDAEQLKFVPPPRVSNFLLYSEPIAAIGQPPTEQPSAMQDIRAAAR